MAQRDRLPSLCWHKGQKQYYIRILGRYYYLGKDQDKADAERLRLLAEWKASGAVGRGRQRSGPRYTVAQLVDAYFQWVQHGRKYHHPDGTPTSEVKGIRLALGFLVDGYGPTEARAYDVAALEATLRAMVDAGLRRKSVNQHLWRLKAAFRWGARRKLVPTQTWQDLLVVESLRRGETDAPEPGVVPPAPEPLVEAARAQASAAVRAMIDVQLWTGARPGEVCALKPCELVKDPAALAEQLGRAVALAGCWAWVPGRHKTSHHGHTRLIPVGPQAQAALAPFLAAAGEEEYVFSPARAREERYAEMRAARKTKVQPSQEDRRKRRPKRRPGARYDVGSYAHAIHAACDRASPPEAELARRPKETKRAWAERLTPEQHEAVEAWRAAHRWHPHQLRHNAGTRLERLYGERVAQLILGHRSAEITRKHYIAPDMDAAFKAAGEAG